MKASDLFSTNRVQEGAISTKVSFESSQDIDLVDSVLDVLTTPLYAYQTSIPIVVNDQLIYKYKQLTRSELVGNYQTIDAGAALIGKYLWAWGRNEYGAVGDNSTIDKSSPVSVIGNRKFDQTITKNFYSGASVGTSFRAALDVDKYMWSWGLNDVGQLGDGTTSNRSSPVSVIGNRKFVTISTGDTDSMGALDLSGCAWSWGINTNGQLGDNTATNKSSPVSVVGDLNFVAIRGNIAIDVSNNVWSWGLNDNGQLGDGTTTNRSSPVSMLGVPSDMKTALIAKGQSFAVMLTNKGKCYTVGKNDVGQLGDTTVSNKSSPILVVGGDKFVQIACGASHTLGLDSYGTIWSWGSNSHGQLGDKTVTNSSSPVSVFSDNKYIMIGASSNTSIAVDVDGHIWCWGDGVLGILGNNNINSSSFPVSVVGNLKGRLRKN